MDYLAEAGPVHPWEVLTERDQTLRLIYIALVEYRRQMEVYDLKHLAVWTANAMNGKSP